MRGFLIIKPQTALHHAVQCIVTCGAIMLFCGHFFFFFCAVWWTPLIKGINRPTKPNPPEGYPSTLEPKSIQFGDCRSSYSKSDHGGSNDKFSLPKSNPPDSTNETSQIQWRSTGSNEISARSNEISTRSSPF